jgi:Pentapeptide repeats (8 copies)
MIIREPRHRPDAWANRKATFTHSWALPFVALEWLLEWLAFFLSNWRFLEVLEYLGTFSVLIAVILFFYESGNRIRQTHYQAWQVINTAQGKGGNGGRIDALQQLNADHVPLVGIDVSHAFLQGVSLPKAHLARANFSASDARNGNFQGVDFSDADLSSANFRKASFHEAFLERATLDDADLWGADLSGSNLSDATFANADLRFADLRDVRWQGIQSLRGANLYGVKNAPEGFVAWATQRGAVERESDSQ